MLGTEEKTVVKQVNGAHSFMGEMDGSGRRKQGRPSSKSISHLLPSVPGLGLELNIPSFSLFFSSLLYLLSQSRQSWKKKYTKSTESSC
jgi:hypothetical protein